MSNKTSKLVSVRRGRGPALGSATFRSHEASEELAKANAFSLIYEGTANSRFHASLPYVSFDSRRLVSPWGRKVLMSHSRYLKANFGIVAIADRQISQHSWGTGITPEPMTGYEEIDRSYKADWERWVDSCDLTGRHSFYELGALACEGMDCDGEIFMQLLDFEGRAQVHLLESHRFGQISNADNIFDRNHYDGVTMDDYSRPLAYTLLEPGMQTREERQVPASDLVHLYDPARCDMIRGITANAPVINRLRSIAALLKDEEVGVHSQNVLGRVIYNESGEADPTEWDDDKDLGVSQAVAEQLSSEAVKQMRITKERLEAGEILRLRTGERLELPESKRPSPVFIGFLDYLIHDVAAARGLSFYTLWNAAVVGGAPHRYEMEKDQKTYNRRSAILIRKLCKRVWFWRLAKRIKAGALPFTPNWFQCWWQPPARASVDAGYDAQNDREDLRAGLTTLFNVAGKRSHHWRDIRAQKTQETDDLIARALPLWEKYKGRIEGLTFERVLQLIQEPGQSVSAAAVTAAQTAAQAAEPAADEKPMGGK